MGNRLAKQEVQYSVAINSPTKLSESAIYKSPVVLPHDTPYKSSLYDSFLESVEKFHELPLFGTRVGVGGKLKEFRWKTYGQVHREAVLIGKGIYSLGLPIHPDGNCFFGIFARNREEWAIFELACITQNITSVGIYDSIRAEELKTIINDNQIAGIAISANKLSMLLKLKAEGSITTLAKIIVFEEVHRDELRSVQELDIELWTMHQLKNLGKETINPPRPSSVYTICYTSGTSGPAKGVEITHFMMMSNIAGVACSEVEIDSTDSHLSYLPIAHIAERAIIHILIAQGGKIGFHSGDMTKLKDDLDTLKPTIFISVPKLYGRFYDIIMSHINGFTLVKRKMLMSFISKLTKSQKDGNFNRGLLESVTLKSIRNILGGKVKLLICATAPISASKIEFLRAAFGVPFIQVYGMTECCGGVFYSKPHDIDVDHVGGPLFNIEYKLVDVPEMGHRSYTDLNGNTIPTGEICLRGPAMFSNYYGMIDNIIVDEDGWLHTGDIGMRLPHNGAVRIIDRRINVVKLEQGVYIPLEKIENIYLLSSYISQILVYGKETENYLVGVVVPDEKYIRNEWRRRKDIQNMDISTICSLNGLYEDILNDMKRLAHDHYLESYEEVTKIYIEPEAWTTEDLLTHTFKLKRYVGNDKYSEIFERLYN